MKLSKKDFSAGEEIELSIQAPYVGSGLITIERDRVYAHAWFTSKTTASTQKITLPADFEGNGFHTFGYHLQAQVMRHGDDGLGDRYVVRVSGNVLDERAIDLDGVNGEAFEITQR